MKRNLILLAFLIGGTFICSGQGMSKFEIWGWKNTKQEFADKYKDKTGIDLNNGYCCEAELGKMGYNYSFSTIYVDNVNDYLSGKLNWDLTDRLTIIRQVSDNKYSRMAADTLWQASVVKLISNLEGKDSLSLNQYITENPSRFREILIGTLAVNKNSNLRTSCCRLLDKKIEFSKHKVSDTELEILGSMLSFPDPQTCYSAMRIISQKKITFKEKDILFKEGAETLKDFLKSNLRSFRMDAMDFLKGLEPDGKDWSYEEWMTWIEK
jgi:hypothetical protein